MMNRDERRYALVALSMVPSGMALHAANILIFVPMGLFGLATMHAIKIVFYLFILLAFWRNQLLFFRLVAIEIHLLMTPMFIALTYVFGLGVHILLFAVISPVIAFLEPHLIKRYKFLLAGLGCIVFAASMGYFATRQPEVTLSQGWITYFTTASSLGLAVIVSAVVAVYSHAALTAETELEREYDRAETLLRNVLPDEIAARLKAGEITIADEHAEVTVLFADICNFTQTAASMRAPELVEMLNRVFSEFDQLCEKYDVEKIKTIGDAYMVVAGLPSHRLDHAEVMTRLALDMHKIVERLSKETEVSIRIRIGLNSGPVVAGVIGTRKFAYDLWGDTVNVASRMEEMGEPGVVYVTKSTRERIRQVFRTRPIGDLELKGKGKTPAYMVVAE